MFGRRREFSYGMGKLFFMPTASVLTQFATCGRSGAQELAPSRSAIECLASTRVGGGRAQADWRKRRSQGHTT